MSRCSLLLGAVLVFAMLPAAAERPRLALVIDDLGWDRDIGERVLRLPGPITVAVLPETPAGTELARAAHAIGLEVILHQPMAADGLPDAGPGTLVADMTPAGLRDRLASNLRQIPHHRGISNHMGSQLTRCERTMDILMSDLARRGLYFLDSRTTHRTVALQRAHRARVPATRRDVFLDNILDTHAIEAALESAVALAEQRGHAVAIGHPHGITLDVLEAILPEIRRRVELVPVSALVYIEVPDQNSAGGS